MQYFPLECTCWTGLVKIKYTVFSCGAIENVWVEEETPRCICTRTSGPHDKTYDGTYTCMYMHMCWVCINIYITRYVTAQYTVPHFFFHALSFPSSFSSGPVSPRITVPGVLHLRTTPRVGKGDCS